MLFVDWEWMFWYVTLVTLVRYTQASCLALTLAQRATLSTRAHAAREAQELSPRLHLSPQPASSHRVRKPLACSEYLPAGWEEGGRVPLPVGVHQPSFSSAGGAPLLLHNGESFRALNFQVWNGQVSYDRAVWRGHL